jgi:hypothetical protein
MEENSEGEVLGFYCETTNTFYAFPDHESYHQFLSMLEEASKLPLPQAPLPQVCPDALQPPQCPCSPP